jgi:hypothetical protein
MLAAPARMPVTHFESALRARESYEKRKNDEIFLHESSLDLAEGTIRQIPPDATEDNERSNS